MKKRGIGHYINIGSEKCCFFVPISKFLIKKLKDNPLLYYAVEESLECEKSGYFSAGILTFSQLLKVFNKKAPEVRHEVAHEILKKQPTQKEYENVKENLLDAVEERQKNELLKCNNKEEYLKKLHQEWNSLMKEWGKM